MEMVKSCHRTVHSPSPSADGVIRHFATTAGQGNHGFSMLNADSRAGRDMRVFGIFNSGEQDGHGKSRMVVSLGGYLLLIFLLPAQSFCQKIYKYPDFRTDGVVAVIDGMERLGHVQAQPGSSSHKRPLAISVATVKSDRQAMPLPVRHSWRMVSPLLATRCGTAG